MNYRSMYSAAPAVALACCLALLACNDNDGTLVTGASTAGTPATAGVPAAGGGGTTATAGTSATPTGAAGRSGVAGSGASGRSGAAGTVSTAGAGGASGAGANAGSGGASGGASEDDAGVSEEDDAGAPPEPEEPTPADAGAPDAQTPTEEPADLGKGDGSDVVTIGDSWMSNTLGSGDGIEGALLRLTRQPYRNYGVQGVLLLEPSLFGPAIPTQYDDAKRRDREISTVIMTGGGNDIIQNPAVEASCRTAGDACKAKLAEITAALNTLWTEMAEDGVKDVVLIRYAEDAGSTDPAVRMLAGTPAICATDKIRCHTVETTAAVMGDLLDGIHPTRAANDRIAKVVQDLLVAKGIRR
jgi:hypothetical protein